MHILQFDLFLPISNGEIYGLKLITLLFMILSFLRAEAREPRVVNLYDSDGKQIEYYEITLHRLQKGDTLKFNDGSDFEFESYLGRGNTTAVLKVKPLFTIHDGNSIVREVALRLPLLHDENPKAVGWVPTRFIDFSIDEYPKLLENHVPVPALYRSLKSQYLAVELVKPEFDLYDFFTNKPKFSPTEKDEVLKKLEVFLKDSSQFRRFSDFRPNQLIYDKEKQQWLLLDFGSGSKLITEKTWLQKIGGNPGNVVGPRSKFLLWYESLKANYTPVPDSFQRKILRTVNQTVKGARSAHTSCPEALLQSIVPAAKE
jgi:hypothetical protein